jgi:hypothetical protein
MIATNLIGVTCSVRTESGYPYEGTVVAMYPDACAIYFLVMNGAGTVLEN